MPWTGQLLDGRGRRSLKYERSPLMCREHPESRKKSPRVVAMK
jgi:hypothetical protein